MSLNEIRYRIIHISMLHVVSRKTIYRFLAKDSTLATIYEMSPSEIHLQFSIPIRTAGRLHQKLHDRRFKKKLIDYLNNYKVITILDEEYPSLLKTISAPPLVVYALGDDSLLKEHKTLSVIGSREPSYEAKPKMDYILAPLLAEKWVIISGMAKGIDGYAHELALSRKAKTIAVLGGGFEYIYPKEHIPLFKRMIVEGLVLSEYPPFVRPARHHFPERNRIISGLSFGTLVIEAMEKSGTMITVGQALEQGREVFAVPGSPLIPQTKGCHLLIQEGAKLTQHADDIIDEWIAQNESGKLKNA